MTWKERTCPWCKKGIAFNVTVCPHCKRDLSGKRSRRAEAEAARKARYAARLTEREGQRVTVTNGFALGFSIFWGFFCGGLILGIVLFVLELAGCGILLGLLR